MQGTHSTYPKVAVQWLNQALCFYQSLCLVDSEVLLNRHLRVAAKRYGKVWYLKDGKSEKQLKSTTGKPSCFMSFALPRNVLTSKLVFMEKTLEASTR
jgi:hypothetical protein